MKYPKLGAMTSLAVLLTVSACGGTGSKMAASDAEQLRLLEAKEARLAEREAELAQRMSALDSATATATPVAAAESDLLPPNAAPGQCFTRVWMEPQYQSVTDRKLLAEASERIEVIPAKYRSVTKRVMVKEASTKLVTVPASYKTVTEQVMVKPARTITETVPAVYESKLIKVLDKPAHTVWKKGTGPIQKVDESTGEIMCLVEVPASYKTLEQQVIKTPATTRTRELPAEYKTVQRRVVDKPAHTKEVAVPAEWTTVTVSEEVSPASERRIPIPAKYTQVSSRKLVKEGYMDWREILCETNTTPERVADIQRALQSAGYSPGAIDGNIGPSTIRAVNAFQRDKGLPVDEYLNVQTVRALGVSPR